MPGAEPLVSSAEDDLHGSFAAYRARRDPYPEQIPLPNEPGGPCKPHRRRKPQVSSFLEKGT
ncbi:hypothetical protein T440DRAFT_468084 [Plenodomus tracheiphilus IPT5]|uniref:Uncharacterized protein n=1 Tax=Plenodomus tracheiphilus IPT5 TaxID=1408161 RepID=A0A6A7B6K8_9PLEO|nr:hypothetical protein T440DRAFT_468084 [Plenodomus tracheiphilus IPT5]